MLTWQKAAAFVVLYSDYSFYGNLTAYDTMIHELRAKLKGEEEWHLWNTGEEQRNTQEVIYAI